MADDDLPPPIKRFRPAIAEQQPTVSVSGTMAKDTSDKPMGSIGHTLPSILPGLDQGNLPYLLCDPVLLAAYYQAALATATATIRAAAVPQPSSNLTIPPSLLPQLLTAPVLQASQKQQQSMMAGASQTLDGSVQKAGLFPVQPRQREPQQLVRERPLLDEATAAAALKLLQLHAGGGDDIGLGKLIGTVQRQESQKLGTLNSSSIGDGDVKSK